MSDINIFACDDSACIFQVNDAALDPRPFYVLSADYSALKEDFDDALGREAALREDLSRLADDYCKRVDEVIALQQRLAVAEQRNESITGKVSSCKDCGSSDLFWFAQNTVSNGIQQNRLNTHDVECVFFLGCNHCSATLKQVSADRIAEKITTALKPAEEGEGS